MALASFQEARSAVELSLSPVYHYQFSSVSKALSTLCYDDQQRFLLLQQIQRMCMSYADTSPEYFVFQTDTTPLCKPYSPTLEDRTYVSMPNNVIAGNRPLNIGYDVSCINLSGLDSKWSLPLSLKRVPLHETSSECALQQLSDLLSHQDLPFAEKMVINTADSQYGNPKFLSPAFQHTNLINITRFRAGMKVWSQYDGLKRSDGPPKVYGEKYYLHKVTCYKNCLNPRTKKTIKVYQRSIFELPFDEHQVLQSHTSKGRKIQIELWRYNNMRIRSKNGYQMKDKPFDLLAIEVRDAKTGKQMFGREMYVTICGQQKDQVATDQAYWLYLHRFDIEPYFRFAKQRLLLQRFQTSNTQHLDNWLLIQQMTAWLLYAASDETHLKLCKWEQYLPENKQAIKAKRLSITNTRKSLQSLLLTLDPIPFKPLKSKKGKGRALGTTFEPRKRFKRVKKVAHKRNTTSKNEQLE